MNIFALSKDPAQCAEWMCDKHVVKMTLETAQILSTVNYIHDRWTDGMYKPTHKNHPCVLWTAENWHNYGWLILHGFALSQEYTKRYGKVHKTHAVLCELSHTHLHAVDTTPFARCFPDDITIECTHEAYREYYRQKAKTMDMKWKLGHPPLWMG